MSPCPTGKLQHATREAAFEHQKKLVYKNHVTGQSERSKGLNVYPCPHAVCGAWHVGHSFETTPPVYHYTIGRYLERILERNALRPRKAHAASEALNEPNPLLWFSWNPEWEHSVLKDSRPWSIRKEGRFQPTGRAVTEIVGQGLIRFGAPASVAKLRWNDYLARNETPWWQREAMAQRGNPTEWLATDQPVSLSQCHIFDVWYQDRWVPGDSISDEEFDAYLETRQDVYRAAWMRLARKLHDQMDTDDPEQEGDSVWVSITPEDDAERILIEDFMVELKEQAWVKAHRDRIPRMTAASLAQQIRAQQKAAKRKAHRRQRQCN